MSNIGVPTAPAPENSRFQLKSRDLVSNIGGDNGSSARELSISTEIKRSRPSRRPNGKRQRSLHLLCETARDLLTPNQIKRSRFHKVCNRELSISIEIKRSWGDIQCIKRSRLQESCTRDLLMHCIRAQELSISIEIKRSRVQDSCTRDLLIFWKIKRSRSSCPFFQQHTTTTTTVKFECTSSTL